MTEPENSLTLDMEARERAMLALQNAYEFGHRSHYCDEWNEGDGCVLCWNIVADVIRAAEGLRECDGCRGTGDVGATAAVCCDECGGNGLADCEDRA